MAKLAMLLVGVTLPQAFGGNMEYKVWDAAGCSGDPVQYSLDVKESCVKEGTTYKVIECNGTGFIHKTYNDSGCKNLQQTYNYGGSSCVKQNASEGKDAWMTLSCTTKTQTTTKASSGSFINISIDYYTDDKCSKRDKDTVYYKLVLGCDGAKYWSGSKWAGSARSTTLNGNTLKIASFGSETCAGTATETKTHVCGACEPEDANDTSKGYHIIGNCNAVASFAYEASPPVGVATTLVAAVLACISFSG